MFILPFIHKKTTIRGTPVSIFHLLLMGSSLWEEEDQLDVIHDILEPNGLVLTGNPIHQNGVYYCPMDPNTKLDDYYRWDEIPLKSNDTFCWKTIYIMGEESKWLPVPNEETLGPLMVRDVIPLLASI
jgi:hypothetical protein